MQTVPPHGGGVLPINDGRRQERVNKGGRRVTVTRLKTTTLADGAGKMERPVKILSEKEAAPVTHEILLRWVRKPALDECDGVSNDPRWRTRVHRTIVFLGLGNGFPNHDFIGLHFAGCKEMHHHRYESSARSYVQSVQGVFPKELWF